MIDDKEPKEEWETENEDWKQEPYNINSCWYCHTQKESGDWLFSCEFDCYLHEACLKEAIKDMIPQDRETLIFKNEFYGE